MSDTNSGSSGIDWKVKTAIIGAVLLILSGMAFIIKVQYDTIKKLQTIQQSVVEQKDIGDGIIRAQSSYLTKEDLDKLIKAQGLNLDAIRKDLSSLSADVKAINITNVVTPGYDGRFIPVSGTGDPNPTPPKPNDPVLDKYGYFAKTQELKLDEPFNKDLSVPFGITGFSAWQDKPWSLKVYPRSYDVTTVIGQDQEGRHYAYSKFQIEVEGKKYVVPITTAKIEEEYPSPKFFFNPRLYLGLDGGAILTPPVRAEITPSVGVSLFSYGKTKITPDWSFLTIGVGYATQTQNGVLILSPVNYNVGKVIPLMSNFQIGPSISVDVKGNIGLYFGGRVAF